MALLTRSTATTPEEELARRKQFAAQGTQPVRPTTVPTSEVAGGGYSGAQAFARQAAATPRPITEGPPPSPYGAQDPTPGYGGAQALARQVAAQPQVAGPSSMGAPGSAAPYLAAGMTTGSPVTLQPTGPRPMAPQPLYPGQTGMAQRAVAGGANIPLSLRRRYYGF